MLTTSLDLDEDLAAAVEKSAQAAGITVIEFITRALHRAVVDAQIDESVARLQAADRLYWTAREIKEAAIRARHPGWSDEQVKSAVKEAFLFARG